MSEVESKCKELVSRGVPVEELVAYMRESGLGKVQSIRVLVEAAGYRLREAKELVHFSNAWADTRVQDEAFHDELLENLDSLGEGSEK